MKTKVLLKAAIAGVVLLLALSFVTCELDLLGLNKGDGEDNLDWEFVDGPNGTAQLTAWLVGTNPIPAKTANRALHHGTAKRSHDLFEAVFIQPSSNTVARASWEIGQAAGIRGVPRGGTYYGVSPTLTDAPDVSASTNNGRSMVLVGRKTGSGGEGTLLGVGFMTHVNGTPITTAALGIVSATARNVTFTVSALSTRIGYDFSLDEEDIALSWGSLVGTNWEFSSAFATAHPGYTLRDTFLTAASDPGGSGTPSFQNTQIGTATFRNNATYTMFGLPKYNDTTAAAITYPVASATKINIVNAIYKVGGLSVPTGSAGDVGTTAESGATIYAAALDLGKGLFLADCGIDGSDPIPPFQITERLAIYQTLGQTYDVTEADLDTYTTVHPTATYNTAAVAGAAFNPDIALEFHIFKDSAGAFAFTFQVPVYALSHNSGLPTPSTNGGPDAIAWYIRPAAGQAQYLLDNGYSASGGAVLMGVGVGSLDWLSIIVHGFGFTNTPYRPVTP